VIGVNLWLNHQNLFDPAHCRRGKGRANCVAIVSLPETGGKTMLGESHDLLHEFPEYAEKIAQLRAGNDVFHNLMDEYNWLDAHIRHLEELHNPVSDFHMEEMKKRRVLLKDRLYAILHG
jgi:uncharacterized protein YdcH (DUF465 family)